MITEYSHVNELQNIFRIAKVALIIPVTNAWPEGGANAVKWIKTRMRYTMKTDPLKRLLTISINVIYVLSLENNLQVLKIVVKALKYNYMNHCRNNHGKKISVA